MAIGDKASDGYMRVSQYIDEALESENLDHDEAIIMLISIAAEKWTWKHVDDLEYAGSLTATDHRSMALNDRRAIDLIKLVIDCCELERKRLIKRSGKPYHKKSD